MARMHRAAALATILAIACSDATAPTPEREVPVRVGSIGVDRFNAPVVILEEEDGTRLLPIWIGVAEATSIAAEIHQQRPARPNSHDFAARLIEGLEGELLRVVVTEIRDGTYYAILVLQANGKRVEIDARPSDAIALAVRVAAPIFATEAVLDRASVIPEPDEEERLSVFRDFVNSLGLDPRQGEGGASRGGANPGPQQEQLSDEDAPDGGASRGDDPEAVG